MGWTQPFTATLNRDMSYGIETPNISVNAAIFGTFPLDWTRLTFRFAAAFLITVLRRIGFLRRPRYEYHWHPWRVKLALSILFLVDSRFVPHLLATLGRLIETLNLRQDKYSCKSWSVLVPDVRSISPLVHAGSAGDSTHTVMTPTLQYIRILSWGSSYSIITRSFQELRTRPIRLLSFN